MKSLKNNDDLENMFLAVSMKIGLLNSEQLYEAGIKENDYFNLNEEVIYKLEAYSRKNKKKLKF